jgi:hypothetical protein
VSASASHTGQIHPDTELLDLVLDAQASTAHLLSSTRIRASAEALVEYALAKGSPTLIAASPMAQRLVGAALLLSEGALCAADEGFIPSGQNILLVEGVAARDSALTSQRERLVALGAKSVEIVALSVLLNSEHTVPVLLKSVA